MAFYILITLLTTVSYAGIGLFVFFHNPHKFLCKIFLVFCSMVAFWAFGYFLSLLPEQGYSLALTASRGSHAAGAFIPVTFLHFTLAFIGRREQYTKLLRWAYIVSSVMFLASITPLVVSELRSKMDFKYYPEKGPLYPIYVGLYIFFALGHAHFNLWKEFMRSKGNNRKRLLYFMFTSFLGFIGGASLFFLIFNIPFPPYASTLIVLYPFAMSYTIIRYHEFDVEVVIKRTLIFAGLLAFVFAVFLVATVFVREVLNVYFRLSNTWTYVLSIFLIVLGYDPIRNLMMNLTDRFLFQKKYDYQKLLKDASKGISRIKSLEHLFGLVTHFITMRMRVSCAAILTRESEGVRFSLEYQRGYGKKYYVYYIETNSPLIQYLINEKESIDVEYVNERIEGEGRNTRKTKMESDVIYNFKAIKEQMEELNAVFSVPSFLGKELRNILILGPKKSGDVYSGDDANVLYTLAQESAIAIENARLYDEAINKTRELEKINEALEGAKTSLTQALSETESANKQLQDTQAQLIHEQKMATLGRLAASVGHEVNNPLTILSMNVSRAILKYRKNADLKVGDILDIFQKMEQNINRIKAVVNTLTGLLKKSEKGKFEPLSLKLILEETLPLVQFQTYLDNLAGTEVDFNVPGSTPLIRGDLERLQEVFLNLFINAYHAMAGRRNPRIEVKAEVLDENPDLIAVHFTDNGSGMDDKIRKKIFNYGYTTKPVGKGSGLGLYMCKYIVELHGGDITVKSQEGVGTTFTLTIPIYKEDTMTEIKPQIESA